MVTTRRRHGRIGTSATAILLLASGQPLAHDAKAAVIKFNIEPQPLAQALNTWADQAGLQIIWPVGDPVAYQSSPAVRGQLEPLQALRVLLDDTGLTYSVIGGGQTVAIHGREQLAQATAAEVPSESLPNTGSAEAATSGELENLEEIVVTGTHIRGIAPDSSPFTVYTRQDIERSGVATVEQFARLIPQNFASLDSSNFLGSASGFNQGGSNAYAGGGFNLRGLGPGSTLTLLNGHRLTPAGANGDFVDVSLIPLSAIERIEVLTDGASAIYGADAVAGVVNMVLRKGFEGAETSVRVGDTTRGGGEEITASQLLGNSWSSGNALFVVEHYEQEHITGSQRSFIPSVQSETTIQPEQDRNSVFFSARQDLLQSTTVSADLFYGDRDYSNVFAPFTFDPSIKAREEGDAKQSGGVISLVQALPAGWQADLSGNFSQIKQRSRTSFASFSVPGGQEVDTLDADTRLTEASLRADGGVFQLPGGQAKLAVGASHRKEKLDSVNAFNDAGFEFGINQSLQRKVTSAFAELFIPLVGASNSMAAAQRLELSLAGRYDDYDDAGSSSNPKIGLLWSPVRGLNLRATYATSFRAPLLTELNDASPTYVTFSIDNPASPTGQTNTLTRQGVANSELRPEESKSFTAGFDLTPSSIPHLLISASYFRTKFSGRIAGPPIVSVFDIYSQTDLLAPFFDFSPDPAEVRAIFEDPRNIVIDSTGLGPDAVEAIFDLRPANIAETRQSGIDASVAYDLVTSHGTFNFALSGNYLLELEYQPVLTAPSAVLMNVVGQPVDLRLQGGLGWSSGALGAFLTLNHWNGYHNVFFTPAEDVSSWTTADLQLTYKTGPRPSADALKNLSVVFTVRNLTDEGPPHVSDPPFGAPSGYDPVNASAFGRALSLALTKQW